MERIEIMNNLTPFGVAIRQLRIQLRIRMYDMAKDLGCSPAFLSSVENGHRPIPDGYVDKIIQIYSLSNDEASKINQAYTITMQRIPLNHLNLKEKELVATFARVVPFMSDKDVDSFDKHLNKIFNNRGKNDI